mgnify:FL=1
MKQQIFIGNIYKVTKQNINITSEIKIKNNNMLICSDIEDVFPTSITSISENYELYKEKVILIKTSNEPDLISKFIEGVEYKNRIIKVNRKNILLSIPTGLNSLFVDEKTLQPYSCAKTKKLVKK